MVLKFNWVHLHVSQNSYPIVFPLWFALGHRYFYAHWVVGSIIWFHWICWRQTPKHFSVFLLWYSTWNRQLQYHRGRFPYPKIFHCAVQLKYRKRQNCYCLWHILYLSRLQKKPCTESDHIWFFKVRRKVFKLRFCYRLSVKTENVKMVE